MSRAPGATSPGGTAPGSTALGGTAPAGTVSGRTALGNTAADLRLVPPALAVWLTAALLLGASPWWTAGVVLFAAVGAVALLVPRRPDGGRAAARRVTWAAVLLCVAASAATAGLHGADLWRGPVPELADRYAAATFEVEVAADPRRARPRPTGAAVPPLVLVDARVVRVTAADGAVTRTRTPVLLMVDAGRAPGRWLEVLPSTRLRVMGRLAPPQRRGGDIAAVVRVDGEGPPRVVAPPSAVQRIAGELRTGLRRATSGLPEDARALLPGLVVGDTSRVTQELRDAFERTDLTHLMAVSGSNFVVLLALLVGPPGMSQSVERRGLAPRLGIGLRATAVLAAGLSLGFVVVCGPEPSVVRAAACGGIALLAMVTGRRRSLLPALAAAVLLLVLHDPWLARKPGFLLSVLATGALLTVAPGWSAALRRRGVPGRVAEALAAAAAAQAVCAPVVATFAQRVSVVGVPCNLLAEFAVAPATVLGFGALITAWVAMPVAEVFAWCGGWPAGWIAGIARTGAALPGGSLGWPGGWRGALLLAAAVALAVPTVRRLLRSPPLASACAFALVLAVVQPVPLTRVMTGWPPPGWRLVMCDVGQGDALVLAAGGGSAVVVDAGPDPGRVDRCLRRLQITRVPLVLLTHFHLDHVAGLEGVLRGRDVGVIETTGLAEPAAQAAAVRRTAAGRGIALRHAVAGERRRTGAVEWEVLWPQDTRAPGAMGPLEPNDASVTLLVRSGGLRMLLLGDLEPPAQRALARGPLGGRSARVDVVKVAHHGSPFQDPELLELTRARLALISCGRDNPYGHPSARTIGALRAAGAQVSRTDRDGSVAVLDGDGRGPATVTHR
ncbi:MBL fold metallo-hydrolase [Streptomyces sp. SID4919]|uniref:ComEC/Rec2 family competence protein n=1 Tax=unclassified Streptomyces TaxID=2593676 RepID=UPI000823E4A7|nr:MULTISPECIES: ComEC/Rec2 family competence protein [unclassified Streptomyces]MYY12861.1 MBL fold metallo-hydrolase [Streptomyces sp. SID4919]SCK21602.1 competence protein ComEC [Streptomyces sp. AmelKG-E11A]